MAYQRKTADILISDELKEILIEIESESIVAYKLLRKRHQMEDLVEGYVNYISISKQDRSRISYLTKDREELLTPEEYWTSSKRYHTKPGGFISKVFSDITQKEVEKFSNLFRTEALKPKFKFNVVSGDDIKRYYSYESYAEDGRGSLGISCMKHNSSQQLLNVYTERRDFVSMLVMLNSDDMLIGRSLLWNFDGNKIMDRIYTHDDEKLQHHFKKWATSNGYLYKSEQNWFNTLYFEKMGSDKKEMKLEIKMNADFKYLPYMDTFKFIDQKTGFLYNYIPEGKNIRTLCTCDGSRHEQDYLRFDSVDRVFRYRGEAPYVDYLNIYTHERNLNWSNIYDKYILKDNSIYNQEIGDYVFNEEFDHLNNKTLIQNLIKQRLDYINERELKSVSRRSGGETVQNLDYSYTTEAVRDWVGPVEVEIDVETQQDDVATESIPSVEIEVGVSSSDDQVGQTLNYDYISRYLRFNPFRFTHNESQNENTYE